MGVWNLGQPLASTSVQLAPLLPPYSHWLNFSGQAWAEGQRKRRKTQRLMGTTGLCLQA